VNCKIEPIRQYNANCLKREVDFCKSVLFCIVKYLLFQAKKQAILTDSCVLYTGTMHNQIATGMELNNLFTCKCYDLEAHT